MRGVPLCAHLVNSEQCAQRRQLTVFNVKCQARDGDVFKAIVLILKLPPWWVLIMKQRGLWEGRLLLLSSETLIFYRHLCYNMTSWEKGSCVWVCAFLLYKVIISKPIPPFSHLFVFHCPICPLGMNAEWMGIPSLPNPLLSHNMAPVWMRKWRSTTSPSCPLLLHSLELPQGPGQSHCCSLSPCVKT